MKLRLQEHIHRSCATTPYSKDHYDGVAYRDTVESNYPHWLVHGIAKRDAKSTQLSVYTMLLETYAQVRSLGSFCRPFINHVS
jgi:hypothetical protein